MFDNRGFAWKLFGALALIAGLGVWAERRADSIHPPLSRCLAQPMRFDGAALWLPRAEILSVASDGYWVDSGGLRIRVDGPAPAAVGDRVSLRGTFRGDGPRLSPARSRVLPPQHRLRWLVEAVSVAVILLVLANFARHFLFRPRVLQVETT